MAARPVTLNKMDLSNRQIKFNFSGYAN